MAFICIVCRELLSHDPHHDVVSRWGAAGGPIPKVNVDIVTTQCGHMYHLICLNDWFNKQANPRRECPHCQSTVVGRDYQRLFPIGDEETDDIESLLQLGNEKETQLQTESTGLKNMIQQFEEAVQYKIALDVLHSLKGQGVNMASAPKHSIACQTDFPLLTPEILYSMSIKEMVNMCNKLVEKENATTVDQTSVSLEDTSQPDTLVHSEVHRPTIHATNICANFHEAVEDSAPNKPSIRQYDRETLLRIGRATTSRKPKVDIPIADVIKVGNGRDNNFEMNFNHIQRTPMNHRQTPNQLRGSMDSRVMGQPIMHPPGMRIGWSMGQPLSIPSTPPPSKLELTTPVKFARDPNAWRPNRNASREDVDSAPDENQIEVIVKQTRGILNKLTQENFDKLCEKFLKLDLNERQDRISAVTKIVFEKAITEPLFSTAYAKMVHHVFQHSQETSKKFRKEILVQFQKEFQKTNVDEDEISKKRKEIEEATDDKSDLLKLELQDFRTRMRRRRLGNVRFIGELFKLQMLTPKIMVECIQMLLENQDEESYECLCKLLTSVGEKLDVSLKDVENRVREAKSHRGSMPKFIPEDNYMDKTFKKLRALSNDNKLSSRIRFALLDLVERRIMIWFPRRGLNLPNEINDVRQGAIRQEKEERRLKKGDWNTAPNAKYSRFNQVKKSNDVSNSPVLALPGVGGWGMGSTSTPPFNRPSSNNNNLPPRLVQQQQLQQQQQQQNRSGRFFTSSGGNRLNSLSKESSSSSVGVNLTHGERSVPPGGPTLLPPRMNPAELHETVKNIFAEYLTVQNSEDTLFWIKERFPESRVVDFVDTLAREVAEMSKEQQHIGAGKLIKMLIKQKYVNREQVLDTIAKGVVPDIPDIQVNSPKVISYVAKSVLELFSDENSLDWLMDLSQLLKDEFEETYLDLIATTLDLFKLKRNEQFVKSLWNKTKNKDSLLYESLPWLSDESRTSLASKMIPVLEENDYQEIVNILKEKSWDVCELEISSALLLAICEVSYVDGKWDEKKLEMFLRLLSQQSGSVSTLWKVAKEFIQQKGIKKEDENFIRTQLQNFNLVTN